MPSLSSLLIVLGLVLLASSASAASGKKPTDRSREYAWVTSESFASWRSILQNSLLGREQASTGDSTCSVCKLAIGTLKTMLALPFTSTSTLAGLGENICNQLQIFATPKGCKGVIDAYADQVFYILKRTKYSAGLLCNLLTGLQCEEDETVLHWNVPLPAVPRPPLPDIRPPAADAKKLRVLHLTDIHFDLFYQPGSNAHCTDPQCCQEDSGDVVGRAAGEWGDSGKCDVPAHLVDNMFSWIAKNDHFDYILMTGDLPDHTIWKQSRAQQLAVLDMTVEYLKRHFPNTPVYPVVGNHESAPCNTFPPPNVGGSNTIGWLYDALADAWKDWLPQDALRTVTAGAYYRINPYPGLRIISLNNNYCYNMNFFLLMNTTDPNGQLAWLINELQAAETAGDAVHIIGHLPPGSGDCMRTWTDNYLKIVARYQGTIRAQFYGHEHKDNVHLYFDPDFPNRATGAVYVGPSVTTYTGQNPGFRVYTIDGDYAGSSWAVLDHETYIANITAANLQPEVGPVWYKEYSAKEAFGLEQLEPRNWNALLDEFERDDAKFQTFFRYYWKSDDTSVNAGCDAACRHRMVCHMRPRHPTCAF
ncbi:sphingomyelin phosphodiesterase-like [Paramacrobiotus metropolitanus]|uniref:sphingomyelin phosphodiesterase-like n=1 Tax=Paramacrobiotus metropolitanus TaxID=2943436 RepID=UPI0024462409|nr:sphingomyelin phosphodiesterase-like [Paramacrobiotus metropolitanus]